MRTVAITQNVTLDGSIEFLGSWFDPGPADDQAGRRVPALRLPAGAGARARLFPDGYEADLRLAEAASFRNGVTYTRYASG